MTVICEVWFSNALHRIAPWALVVKLPSPACLTNEKSTMGHVMTWSRQATGHYLSQCWHRCVWPYGVKLFLDSNCSKICYLKSSYLKNSLGGQVMPFGGRGIDQHYSSDGLLPENIRSILESMLIYRQWGHRKRSLALVFLGTFSANGPNIAHALTS